MKAKQSGPDLFGAVASVKKEKARVIPRANKEEISIHRGMLKGCSRDLASASELISGVMRRCDTETLTAGIVTQLQAQRLAEVKAESETMLANLADLRRVVDGMIAVGVAKPEEADIL